MYRGFLRTRPAVSIFHHPSSALSKRAVDLLRSALIDPYPPGQHNVGPLDFDLEVVESSPTPDQIKTILSYLPSSKAGPSTFISSHPSSAGVGTNGQVTSKTLTELARTNPNALKWPIVVDWMGGRASVGDIEGLMLFALGVVLTVTPPDQERQWAKLRTLIAVQFCGRFRRSTLRVEALKRQESPWLTFQGWQIMPGEWDEGLTPRPGQYDDLDEYPTALNVEPQDHSLDTTSQSTFFTQSSDSTSTVTNHTVVKRTSPPLSRPSPLRSCLKKASSTGDAPRNSSKRRVVIEHPDGQREPARPRSMMTSVKWYLRKLLSLASGFESRSEWVQRSTPNHCNVHSRRSVNRLSMAALDAQCLRDLRRSQRMSSMRHESQSILDFDDHPPRWYF